MTADAPRDAPRRGIAFCLASLVILAAQDTATKILAQDYHVAQFVTVRYAVFALFALAYAWRRGRLAAALRPRRPWLQAARSLLLVAEIGIFATAIRHLGLAEIHSILATFPLLATALAVPLLGEKVGARRWTGVGVGFLGTLVILRPGMEGLFGPAALLALLCALLYALYNLLTRLASRRDTFETAMVQMAVIGCAAVAPFGVAAWVPPAPADWALMGFISVTGIAAHLLIIKSLECAPASLLQPFNYTLLLWATLFGWLVFGALPDGWTVLGAVLVTGGGLYVIARERRRKGRA
ncbi:MAG: DMT family transporter [Hyphomicrobiales bacterium]|nr:DMT family transporter [Hyphomicrobiales bacterium]